MTADANGSVINWAEELDQHARWIRSVLRSRINDHHIVEDLFQDVSLAVLRQSSRPTDRQKIAPWLYRLAVRQSINHHRRHGRQRRLQQQLEHEAGSGNVRGDTPDAVDWLLRDELNERVRRAVDQLRPQDREILVLKYTEHWSYAELAAHLGASLGTIEYRLIRARKALRKQLTASNLNSLSHY